MTTFEIIGYSLMIIGGTIGLTSLFFHEKFYGILKSNRRIPNEYLRVKVIVDLGEKEKVLMKKNKELLSANQVPFNKIYFVFTKYFSYDIDKNKINPEYEMMLPLRTDNSGLFDKNAPVIEINKPNNWVRIGVNHYSFGNTEDNYTFIKRLAKKTKRGIVIYLGEEIVSNKKVKYSFGVDTDIICLINLDDAIEAYNYVPQDSVI